MLSRYYADVAEQYAASRLERKKSQQWLYVMCLSTIVINKS